MPPTLYMYKLNQRLINTFVLIFCTFIVNMFQYVRSLFHSQVDALNICSLLKYKGSFYFKPYVYTDNRFTLCFNAYYVVHNTLFCLPKNKYDRKCRTERNTEHPDISSTAMNLEVRSVFQFFALEKFSSANSAQLLSCIFCLIVLKKQRT